MDSETRGGIPAPMPSPPIDGMQERLELIKKYRRESVKKSDPLVANLSVIAADLMTFSAKMADSIEKKLEQSDGEPVVYQEFERRAEMFLKFARQIDRISRITQEKSSAE